jgi:phosphohistidine phosphatase
VIVVLVRHAIAEERRAGLRDAARRLTPEGVEKLEKAAAGLKRLGVAPDRILTSPLTRAADTAAGRAEDLAPGQRPQSWRALAPGQPPQEVRDALPEEAGTVVLVGHEPDLGELASWLLTGRTDGVPMPFRKAGAAAIELEEGAATLRWMLAPRQLRALGRG